MYVKKINEIIEHLEDFVNIQEIQQINVLESCCHLNIISSLKET